MGRPCTMMRLATAFLIVLFVADKASRADEPQRPYEVVVAPASADDPRNTEADIVELADGRLWLVYTRFQGGTSDHQTADLFGMQSTDGGKTWGQPRLLKKNNAEQNVMSVSLVRLTSGKLLLGYLRKNSDRDCRFVVCHSDDEGRSWGDEIMVTERTSYYVVNNDRVVQLAGGRLLVPAADHGDISLRPNSPAVCFHSDDEGASWHRGRGDVRLGGIGCQEPGVVELSDGRVYMIIRNSLGSIYRAISDDGGLTWSEGVSTGLTSPVAPASISRLPDHGKLVIIYNNSPDRRVPLTAAVSADEGETWTPVGDLETDGQSYAYTSITWIGNTAALSYWTQSPQGYGLKVRLVPRNWFDRQ